MLAQKKTFEVIHSNYELAGFVWPFYIKHKLLCPILGAFALHSWFRVPFSLLVMNLLLLVLLVPSLDVVEAAVIAVPNAAVLIDSLIVPGQ